MDKTGERTYEAELYRIKGELLLHAERKMRKDERKTKGRKSSSVPIHHSSFSIPRFEEAETCFIKVLEIARQQQAKSLELRAVMSLVRLRQQQAAHYASQTTHHEICTKLNEAHRMLVEVYSWFTEGFEMKDLQEAKALIQEMSD